RALEAYPMAAGAAVEMAEVVGQFGYEKVPTIQFPDGEQGFRTLSDVGDRVPTPPNGRRFSSQYVLRPQIGEVSAKPPSQLMTLWALVYGMSQLARYHPDLWVGALNPNQSEIA